MLGPVIWWHPFDLMQFAALLRWPAGLLVLLAAAIAIAARWRAAALGAFSGAVLSFAALCGLAVLVALVNLAPAWVFSGFHEWSLDSKELVQWSWSNRWLLRAIHAQVTGGAGLLLGLVCLHRLGSLSHRANCPAPGSPPCTKVISAPRE